MISLNAFIVPQGTTKIKNEQFSGRSDLKEIYIPQSIEALQAGCFYNCVNLKTENLPHARLQYYATRAADFCKYQERYEIAKYS